MMREPYCGSNHSEASRRCFPIGTGHERQLAQAIGNDGRITLEVCQLLLRLAGRPVSRGAEEPGQ